MRWFRFFIALLTTASLHNAYSNTIIDSAELAKDAKQIVANIGLNCASPQNWRQFISEVQNLVRAIPVVANEMALQLATKKDYPNVCHVLTQPQINAYTEGKTVKNSKHCIKRVFGKCMAYNKIRKTRASPSYYWPKYQIEVTEKGNDPHSSFASGNKLYTLNRQISNTLSGLMDTNGSLKLMSLAMGANTALTISGFKAPTGEDLSNVGQGATKLLLLEQGQKIRLRSSSKKTNPTYDVNIWPIVGSKTIAKHLTVCGPLLDQMGLHPGGYSWPLENIPMTCPVATSSDAYTYWDTGLLDYIDPETVSSMVIGSNPLTCGMAAGAEYLSNMSGAKGNKIGESSAIESKLKSTGNLKTSLGMCSWPILGQAEAIAKKSLALIDLKKWTSAKCTIWGSMAPRSSNTPYNNDYSFANTALKFKLFAHEMFGLPRGEKEKWSLSFPWEEGLTDGKFASISNSLKQAASKLGIKTNRASSNSRSEDLMTPGNPSMINASSNPSHLLVRARTLAQEMTYSGAILTAASAGGLYGNIGMGGAEVARLQTNRISGENSIGGDRRIYTIWEQISCSAQSQITEVTTPGGFQIKQYDSCSRAVQFEVYKYVQLKLLRRVCDSLGFKTGAPWK